MIASERVPAQEPPAAVRSGRGAAFQHILLLCVGNVCRSPMAAAALRHRVPQASIRIESAGLKALSGSPVDPRAEAVLAAHGLSAGAHVARQVSRELIDAADLVLVMEKRHRPFVLDMAPCATGKTFLLGKWIGEAEIPDPYRRSGAAFESTFELIERAVTRWRTFL